MPHIDAHINDDENTSGTCPINNADAPLCVDGWMGVCWCVSVFAYRERTNSSRFFPAAQRNDVARLAMIPNMTCDNSREQRNVLSASLPMQL